MKTALIYMGKKGAGVEFSREIINFMKIDALVISTKLSDRKLNEFRNSYKLRRNFMNYPILYFFSFFWSLKIIQFLKSQKVEQIIFPMFSPLDYVLLKKLKNKFKIVSIIHDSSRHPGDLWPLEKAIKAFYFASDKIICLSNFTKNELLNKYGDYDKVNVIPHPILFSNLEISNIQSQAEKSYILIIGRIRKYKGIEIFLRPWLKEFDDKFKLIIAGEGKLNYKIPKNSKIKLISRWLSEREILELIKNSLGVIFPYIEASQSGLLPVAIANNKWVLISDVGGLREQATNYSKVVFYNPFVTDSQVLSINQFLQKTLSNEANADELQTFTWEDFMAFLARSLQN